MTDDVEEQLLALVPIILPKHPSDDWYHYNSIAKFFYATGLDSVIWADHQGEWVLIITGRAKE